jgi:diguanylate cyclase (GGDEF)-like protein
MTGPELSFLVLRAITTTTCMLAAFEVARYGRHRGLGHGRWLPTLAAMSLMLMLGVLAAAEAEFQVYTQVGEPITLRNWFWLGTDLLLPIAMLGLLRVLRQRDALEGRLIAAARHDPLTELPNRAGFAQAAQVALAIAARHRQPLAVAMLDIDRFKRINDEAGHAAGDAVLRATAHAMRTTLRPGDVIARMGGEEFALIYLDASPEEALPLLERLRDAVRHAVPHPVSPALQVTLSGGVAAVLGPDKAAMEAALGAADTALYAAKTAGRDRCAIAA